MSWDKRERTYVFRLLIPWCIFITWRAITFLFIQFSLSSWISVWFQKLWVCVACHMQYDLYMVEAVPRFCFGRWMSNLDFHFYYTATSMWYICTLLCEVEHSLCQFKDFRRLSGPHTVQFVMFTMIIFWVFLFTQFSSILSVSFSHSWWFRTCLLENLQEWCMLHSGESCWESCHSTQQWLYINYVSEFAAKLQHHAAICAIASVTVTATTTALWFKHEMKHISSRGPYFSSRKASNSALLLSPHKSHSSLHLWNDAPILGALCGAFFDSVAVVCSPPLFTVRAWAWTHLTR